MSYIEGFVLAVPTANKEKFIAHAEEIDPLFLKFGARRVLEGWGEDIPSGKQTDFFRAVEAKDDETVCFSWIEWPDKAAREQGMGKIMEMMKAEARFDPAKNPVPFDGKRMIFGGFEPIVDEGKPTPGAYVQGFVLAVPEANKEAYRKMATKAWDMFGGYGALRLVEAWQEEVPEGKQTDFFRSVQARPDEKVVFSFVEWPSREACDAASAKMQAEVQPPSPDELPFDGKRMIYGGFQPVVERIRQTAGA